MSKKSPIRQFLEHFGTGSSKIANLYPFYRGVGVENPFKQWEKTHFCQIGPFCPPTEGPSTFSPYRARIPDYDWPWVAGRSVPGGPQAH